MSDSGHASLLQVIVERYARSGPGSPAPWDRATLPMRSCTRPICGCAIQKPDAFIFRTALNIATDKRREASRRASLAEILAVTRLAEGAQDLSREMEARLELEVLKRALAELPPRRRAIFIAARVDGISHEEIARRFGLSRTMVQKELRRAIDHCLDRLGENHAEG